MTKRETLIAAAAQAIEDMTVEGMTVREVARRAKQSTIGIYRNFSGKTGLLDALFLRGFERLGSAASAAAASGGSARDAVMETISEYLDLARSQPQHYRLMFSPATAGFTPTSEARSIAFANYARFVELVERLPGRERDARQVAGDLFALVHGHVALRAQNFGPEAEPSQWIARIMASVERQLEMLGRSAAQ
ncbi:TetR/AcrR family transcriptional regulator [Aurantiacibacter marinus]|uniref:HTH tetR-type domain-containing protein n=1 Tax=Aurantiacibacter marinus TaxID=874156 RepID=A0A0H0XS92_9SPHN|nr:TetR/AcrR family transcriptional regulator [Aurantiacibacter marinus]KLI63180.1 hypothetical protein AAV99_10870 [Aurantiacibacter marinus]